jgi:Bax protein
MPPPRRPLFIFAGVAITGAIAYGAATAYPVEQSREPVIVAAPVLPALIRELPPPEPPPLRNLAVASVGELAAAFDSADYYLAPIRHGQQAVPRLMLVALPVDYHGIEQVEQRKRLFFKTMLPLVLRVNEEIVADRRRLFALVSVIEAGRELAPADRDWLDALSERYRTNPGEFAELLRRVDAVSPALAIAQSIEESGWGRSRFARDGNALFGQRVWAEGVGIVPEEREDSEAFEVRAFDRLIDSVRAYALNLNRHPAYEEYRLARARLRETELALDPYVLAGTLSAYSERREEYVDTLKKIIKANRLEQFELARLKRRLPSPHEPERFAGH